jgi:hypothetical protein
MIRAVVDTNLIVSALFWGGLPRALLDAAKARKFRMVVSNPLVIELKEVMARPKFADRLAEIGETVESLLETDYFALVEVVEAANIEPVVIDDPDDDILIACALGGAASYIISGDHHLLNLGQYLNITVVTASQFLEHLSEA